MRGLGFYGKGGIGKSTVVSNLSLLFARSGARVLQVGCDPKADSTDSMTCGDRTTVMEQWLAQGDGALRLEHFLMKGRGGVACIETGGPTPGVGCAGRGITKAFELIGEPETLGQEYDVVLFDVLGDVVCGGFSAPMRAGYADEIFIVTSGEARSLYAANNLCWAIRQNARNGARLSGVIGNLRDVPEEVQLLEGFCSRIGAQLVGTIPRDDAVALAERAGTPVVLHAPGSAASQAFEALQERIAAKGGLSPCQPTPVGRQEFAGALQSFFRTGG